MLRHFTKQEKSWIFYDWANSAYATIIMAAIMPIYFNGIAVAGGLSESDAFAYWGYANTIGAILVAVLSPILGTLADYRGLKKRMFVCFFILAILSTGLLGAVSAWQTLWILYILTAVGFSGANVFYDAFLMDVTTKKRMDKVSSYGFAMGYIGGSTIPFLAAMLLVSFGEQIGISQAAASRISFFITAVWWAVFSIPMLKNVHQVHGIDPEPHAVRNSLRRLGSLFREAAQHKRMFVFLMAYLLYIDGVGTIIKMASSYSTTLGIGQTTIMIALFLTQIVAFPFAILYGKLSERFGARNMVLFGVATYVVICIGGFLMTEGIHLILLATLIGTAQGGIQALSRSYFGKMIPDKSRANEYYGLYNICGKFEAVLGTLIMGVVTQLTGETRYGVLGIIILFLLGGILLLCVPRDKGESSEEE